MAENFTSRRRGGPEGLTIFASSRRQTLGSVFALFTAPCEQTSLLQRRAKLIIEPILNGQWETAEKLKSKSGYVTVILDSVFV